MKDNQKREIVSDLKEKISKFRTNFVKNREKEEQSDKLNIEINRNTLKQFFRNKNIINEDNKENFQENKEQPIKRIKKEKKEKDIKTDFFTDLNLNFKNIKNDFLPNTNSTRSQFNNREQNNNRTYIEKNNTDRDINNIKIGQGVDSMPTTKRYECKIIDVDVKQIFNQKKLEKREKSAPKISTTTDFFINRPLNYKSRKNSNINPKCYNLTGINNRRIIKYNTHNFSTEEKMQQLLSDFNIEYSIKENNKRKIPYLNINYYSNNQSYFTNYKKRDYAQKGKNILQKFKDNKINHIHFSRKNHMHPSLNNFLLDKNINKYSTKSHNQSLLQNKIDLFYKELNNIGKSNKKIESKNYADSISKLGTINKNNNDNYYESCKYTKKTYQYNNIEQRFNRLDCDNNKNNNQKKISFSDIYKVKIFIKDLSKEEMMNLPENILNELKDIFNILNEKLN